MKSDRILGLGSAIVAGLTVLAATTFALAAARTADPGPADASAAMRLAQAEAPPSTLPGGATSLRETHGDWIVQCSQQGAAKGCSLVQSQTDKRTQKRVLAIELRPPEPEMVNGALVLPFGLLLDNGVTLQIDDREASQPLRFKTCIPNGCVVPLSFGTDYVEGLRSGSALKVNAVASDNGNAVAFSVSLIGFTGALTRAAELAQ